MGPPLVNGGNSSPVAERKPRAQASMGPPLVNGGNLRARWLPAWARVSFNGAAVSERRKWQGGYELGSLTEYASMGPPLVNGGNQRRRGRWLDSWRCFNGAAVSERRKSRRS